MKITICKHKLGKVISSMTKGHYYYQCYKCKGIFLKEQIEGYPIIINGVITND